MKIEDYSKYYIQGSDHYLIPKDVFKGLFNEMINWKEESIELKKQNSNLKTALGEGQEVIVDYIKENQELKKQLEERTKMYLNACKYAQGMENEVITLNTQQKEFIKYLEDEIEQNTPNLKWKHYNEDGFNDYDVENPSCIEVQPTDKVYKEILQKFKEIIGDDKE